MTTKVDVGWRSDTCESRPRRNFYAGKKALEMYLPIVTTEVSNALNKSSSPRRTSCSSRFTEVGRWLHFPDSSNHNGVRMSSALSRAGHLAADGRLRLLRVPAAEQHRAGAAGETDRASRTFTPTGRSSDQPTATTGTRPDWLNRAADECGLPRREYPDWKPMPNFLPVRDRWYCYELMVKPNTSARTMAK